MLYANTIRRLETQMARDPSLRARLAAPLAEAYMKRARATALVPSVSIQSYIMMKKLLPEANLPAYKVARAHLRMARIFLSLDKIVLARRYFGKAHSLAYDTHHAFGTSYTREESLSLIKTMRLARKGLARVEAREKEIPHPRAPREKQKPSGYFD